MGGRRPRGAGLLDAGKKFSRPFLAPLSRREFLHYLEGLVLQLPGLPELLAHAPHTAGGAPSLTRSETL
jgi:hypothetical protein